MGASKLVEVSKETESLLMEKCTSRLSNSECLKRRNNYALPKVPATKSPSLDGYLKSELSRTTKAADKELATCLMPCHPSLLLLRLTLEVRISAIHKVLMQLKLPLS